MSKEDVTHRGVIEKVERGYLVIRTEDECKCDGCAITALCNSNNSKGNDKKELLTIDTPSAGDYTRGERVEVSATSDSTLRATWWALILPTLIFGGAIVGLRLGFPTLGGWSIALAFVALGIYDLFLYRFRKSLAQKISWKIRKI
ncbi:SoxR reducing system RseC family protein [uncultured Duncaniella sp.]|uniref:SoxR reducing system RseC family protein n=1 Tax=uncultured Duncaniella sp. TaxID=2768039 RepID=UPI0025CDCBE5|nr:SoxR reducing system RseC family protein [uncultured Duncaniella sp.]